MTKPGAVWKAVARFALGGLGPGLMGVGFAAHMLGHWSLRATVIVVLAAVIRGAAEGVVLAAGARRRSAGPGGADDGSQPGVGRIPPLIAASVPTAIAIAVDGCLLPLSGFVFSGVPSGVFWWWTLPVLFLLSGAFHGSGVLVGPSPSVPARSVIAELVDTSLRAAIVVTATPLIATAAALTLWVTTRTGWLGPEYLITSAGVSGVLVVFSVLSLFDPNPVRATSRALVLVSTGILAFYGIVSLILLLGTIR